MSRYSRWGFFKNKRNAGTLSNPIFYPRYPDLPDSDTFYTFLQEGYTKTAEPVANINLTLGSTFNGYNNFTNQNKFQFTAPDGSVFFITNYRTGGPPPTPTTDSTQLFKYDADAGNIVRLNPSKSGTNLPIIPPDLIIQYMKYGCLCYDGFIRLYGGISAYQNVTHIRIKTDGTLIQGVNTHSQQPAPIIEEDKYPDPTKVMALDNGKVLIFPHYTSVQNDSDNRTAIKLHDVSTDKFANTTLRYDWSNSINMSNGSKINAVNVPGTGSVGSPGGNVYIIPARGFLQGGDVVGSTPAANADRELVEFDPNANTYTRFTPTGANLSVSGTGWNWNYNHTLFMGAGLGVDGNVYAFPGQIRKEILALDPINKTAVQSTFNIYETDGNDYGALSGNTIICEGDPILGFDGHLYQRARGIQEAAFTGEQDFWLSIDTNPNSATYRQGNIIPVDPNEVYTYPAGRKVYAIAKDGLILNSPAGPNDSNKMPTLQTYGTGNYVINMHPGLQQTPNTLDSSF